MAEHLENTYQELRQLAARYLGRDRAHSLQPTALVHEAWLRLGDRSESEWNGRTHFLATCARAMRHVLVDLARSRGTKKRGGERVRVTLSGAEDPGPGEGIDMIDLNDALTALGERSERQARIVELRLFAGMTVDEVAATLGVSARTVAHDWRFAQAWLSRELRRTS